MLRRDSEKQQQQQGRRLVMYTENKRQMLQNIRDSLSHVRKSHDPADASVQNKADSSGRTDYNKEAMAKIKDSLEQFAIPPDPDGRETGGSASTSSEEVTDQLRAKEIIQKYLAGKDSFPRNGMTKFGGLVPPGQRPLQRKHSMEQQQPLLVPDDRSPRQGGTGAVQIGPYFSAASPTSTPMLSPSVPSSGDASPLASYRAASPPPPLPPPRQTMAMGGAAAAAPTVTSATVAPAPPLPPRISKTQYVVTGSSSTVSSPTSVPPVKKALVPQQQPLGGGMPSANGQMPPPHHAAMVVAGGATGGGGGGGRNMQTLASSLAATTLGGNAAATAAAATAIGQQPTNQVWLQRPHPFASAASQPFAPSPFGLGLPGGVGLTQQQQQAYFGTAASGGAGPGRPPSPAAAALTHGQSAMQQLAQQQHQQRIAPPPPYSVATAASSSSSVASSIGGSSSGAGDYQVTVASGAIAGEYPSIGRHQLGAPLAASVVTGHPPEYRPSPPYYGSSSGNSSPSTSGMPFQYNRPGVGGHPGSTMSPTGAVSPWDSRQALNGQGSTAFQGSPHKHSAAAAAAGAELLPVAPVGSGPQQHQQQMLPAYQPPPPAHGSSAQPPASAPHSYYMSSVQARVGSGGEGSAQQQRASPGGQQQPVLPPPRGNVHIQLRNQKDPCVSVTGNPSFQVTAVSSPKYLPRGDVPASTAAAAVAAAAGQPHLPHQPAIQIQFGCPPPPHVISEAHLPPGLVAVRGFASVQQQHDGSCCGSDSPAIRTTNPSPQSMLSTASNASSEQQAVCLDRPPPPPYPGGSLANVGYAHYTQTPTESDTQSEADMGSCGYGNDLDDAASNCSLPSAPAVRCESPIPERKPEAQRKDAERRDTKVQHYSPQAFKFYMEQHVENVLKQHKERIKRRAQLENEMDRASLCEETRTEMRRMLRQKESNFLRMRRAKMERGMFERIKGLGVGAFGEVALVRKSESSQLFAMKTLRKADVLRRNQVAHVKAERDILAEADCDWVVKLFYSFQDKDNLYFIMEYIPGGDMMSMLIKFGIFEESLARFYVAELVCAIESVHRIGFIHRDIKPDNVLIDRDGHIKLTDFGLCTGFRWTHNSKYYQNGGGHARQDSMEPDAPGSDCNCVEILKPLERRRQRERLRCLAHSLVGTPNYIAPEVLLRSGYTRTCDWWSVGVILFEMLVGRPPFLANSAQETQYKVINWERTLRVPEESNLSRNATSLILGLCCGPAQRLGANGGAEEIKQHPFFDGIVFSDLRKQKAPYKPPIKHETDTSNFDSVDDIEQHHHDDEDFRNGKYPEHAFVEFTFRRFFDDIGHPMKMTESLERHSSDTYGGIPIYGRNGESGTLSGFGARPSDSGIDSSRVNGVEENSGSESFRSLGAPGAAAAAAGMAYGSPAGSEVMAHRTPENPVYV